MTYVNLPTNETKSMNEILDDLKEDNILIKEPKKDILDEVSKYFTSYLQRNIFANRYKNIEDIDKYFNTRLWNIVTNKDFISKELPDVKKASEVIYNHIEKNNHIVIISDYDVDGVTSAAIGYKMFVKLLGYTNVEIIINRRENGNGINKVIVEKILNYNNKKKIDLIITSDHGSHDRANLTTIKDSIECDIIVTDHHLYEKEDAPFNMDAFVNPQRDNNSILKDMTGTGVLYFTILYTVLEHYDDLTLEQVDYIYYLLTYVGMTIISDCMDLKNYVNRKILIKTLVDLNDNEIKHDAFWKYIRTVNLSTYVIDETTLGFNIIPMLNSPGRISNPRLAFEFMITDTIDDAAMLYEDLTTLNAKRKEIQVKATGDVKKEEYQNGIIKVVAIDNSDGVQGIIANNIMYDENYKVVICFTKNKDKDIYIGSGRSQDENISLKEVIDNISNDSDMILNHGGHKKAIGIKIKPDLKKFYLALQNEVNKQKMIKIEKLYVEEYVFSIKKILLNIFDIIEAGPYGIGFERPLFASDFIISSYRIYKFNSHLFSFKVKFNNSSNFTLNAFYSIKSSELEYFEEMLKKTKFIRMVYSLNVNTYRNHNKILLQPVKIIFKEDG